MRKMKFLFQAEEFRDKKIYKLCQMFFNDVGSSHLNSVVVHYFEAGAKDGTCDHKTDRTCNQVKFKRS